MSTSSDGPVDFTPPALAGSWISFPVPDPDDAQAMAAWRAEAPLPGEVEIDGHRYANLRPSALRKVLPARADTIIAEALARHAGAAVAAEALRRLQETDHWPLKAYEAGEDLSPERRAYREALRGLIRNPPDRADAVVWPVRPE